MLKVGNNPAMLNACVDGQKYRLIELYDKLIVIPYKMIGNGIMFTYIGLSVEFRGPAWPFKNGRNYLILRAFIISRDLAFF